MRACAALLLALLGRAASAQEPPAPPPRPTEQFPGQVERITVDVVVSDKDGQPVTGLTKDDFTVLEGGLPRAIASFDVVSAPASSGPAAPARPRSASNQAEARRQGRTFVLVFDDMHMSPLNARRAKAAVVEFLQRGAHDGDRVTLLSTAGSAWWSTRLPEGREDLLAILKRLDGRRFPDNALERLTDHEAVRIFVYQDTLVATRVRDRFERYSTKSREDMAVRGRENAEQLFERGQIDPYVQQRAQEQYFRLRSRQAVTLSVLERALNALEGGRDRKAVVLVSEGFVYDPTYQLFQKVTEAARRANAALYFVDTLGLEALGSAYSTEFGFALDERNLLAAIADVSMEGDGAEFLADETGGFSVRRTNDFAGGAVRIGQESGSYYLLGYDPGDVPADGRFHRLEVRVRGGKGLTVRARRGYYAPGPSGGPAASAERDPQMQRALDAPAPAEDLPLRLTAYALDERTMGRARVVVAADVDVSKAGFVAEAGRQSAALDTLVVLSQRESGEFFRDDQRADLARSDKAPPQGPLWYSFLREFEVPAGSYQVRLVVRDVNSRRLGSLLFQFDVPPLDQLRVSTPILSDVLQKTADGSGLPALLVRRTFASAGVLYCLFDVYGAGKGPDGKSHVLAAHELLKDGISLGKSDPRPIQPTSLGALMRLIQIPLGSLEPADYELRLTVEDGVSGQKRELREPFTVGPAASAAR